MEGTPPLSDEVIAEHVAREIEAKAAAQARLIRMYPELYVKALRQLAPSGTVITADWIAQLIAELPDALPDSFLREQLGAEEADG